MREHHRELRAFLVRRVGNLAVADDLAQEVFLAAMKQAGSVEDRAKIRAWLYQVARNKVVDYFRRTSREKNSLNEIESMFTAKMISQMEQVDSGESELEMNALRTCVSNLNERSKALVEEFYFQNKAAEEIAAESDRKSNAVRMALLRIRKALAVCIRKKMEMNGK